MMRIRPKVAVLFLLTGLPMEPRASGQQPPAGATLWRHEGAVLFVAFTPDGKHIITATYEGAIRKWDAVSGKNVLQIERPINQQPGGLDVRCRAAALSPDGKTLAVLTYASALSLYNVATGKPFRHIKTGDDQMSGASAVAFVPGGKSVATSRSQGREVTYWDLASGTERKFGDPVKGPATFGFSTLSISSNGTILASAVNEFQGGQRVGTSVRRWRLPGGKELAPAKGGDAGSVVLAPDGKTAVWGNWKTNTLRLWDLDSDKEIRKLEGTGTAYTFSADGKLLAGRDTERVLCVWDVQTGKEPRRLGKPASRPLSSRADVAAFSANGKRLVTGVGTEVRQWDIVSGKEIGPAAGKE